MGERLSLVAVYDIARKKHRMDKSKRAERLLYVKEVRIGEEEGDSGGKQSRAYVLTSNVFFAFYNVDGHVQRTNCARCVVYTSMKRGIT